jgi:hypothetical protein
MRVVVPALTLDNVAVRCLRSEGIEPEVHVLDHDLAYAQLMVELWRDGESFVLVEDDIAPWPGAIGQLCDCTHYWCGFHYTLPGRWDPDDEGPYKSLWGTSGCIKVTDDVLRAAPSLYKRFETHSWQTLDVALSAALRHVVGLEATSAAFHVHGPPVAHAMHYRPEATYGRREDVVRQGAGEAV